MEPLYLDLLINNNDLKLDAGGQPELTNDRACISQDLVHMLRDSGLLVDIIGERNKARRKTKMVEISLLIDEDIRLVPGSVRIEESKAGEFWLTADTKEFQQIGFALGIS